MRTIESSRAIPVRRSRCEGASTRRSRCASDLILALTLVATPASYLRGVQVRPSEYEVKAVYLYNFAKFTEWPVGLAASSSFEVCVLGEDPFGGHLQTTIAGEMLDGRRAAARRIARLGDASSCRVLFISASEEPRLDRILEALRNKSILTVSDIASFSRRGGMIELLVEDARVRFEVNLTAASRAGLTLRSELLKVAKAVRQDPEASER